MSLVTGLIGHFGAQDAKGAHTEGRDNSARTLHTSVDKQQKHLTDANTLARDDLLNNYRHSQNIYQQIPQAVAPIYESGFQNLKSLGQEGVGSVQDLYSGFFGDATDELDELGGNLNNLTSSGHTMAMDPLNSVDVQGYLGNQLDAFGQAESGIAPYTTAGVDALSAYSDQATNPLESEAFKRKLAKGQEHLNDRLAAQGLSRSGAALELSSDLYQDLADTEMKEAADKQLNLLNLGANQQSLLSSLASGKSGAYGGALQKDIELASDKSKTSERFTDRNLNNQQIETLNKVKLLEQQGILSADAVKQMYSQLTQASAGKTDAEAGLVGTSLLQQGGSASEIGKILAAMDSQYGDKAAGTEQDYANAIAGIYTKSGDDLAANKLYRAQSWSNAVQQDEQVAQEFFGKLFGGGMG